MGSSNPLRDLYLLDIGIQHRGQESAGFAIGTEGGFPVLCRGYGTVDQVFQQYAEQSKTRATRGIAHTRYSTTGGSSLENAQPLLVENPSSGNAIIIGHNGNLMNGQGLRQKYQGEYNFKSTTDTEAIGYILSQENDLLTGAERVFDECEGSFNLVVMNGRGELAIIRDEHAFQPLVWTGMRDGGSYAASENIALTALGIFDWEYVPPGEAIVYRNDGSVDRRNFKRSPGTLCCPQEVLYFMRHGSVVMVKGKPRVVLDVRKQWGRMLWDKYQPDISAVSYVPESGRGYVMGLDVPIDDVFSRNQAVGRTYIHPEGKGEPTSSIFHLSRLEMTMLKLSPIVEKIKGRRVALYDDTNIRGNAQKAVARLLFGAGAESVEFYYAGPPFRYPCFYGKDHSTRRELIARHCGSVEEANERIAREVAEYCGVAPGRVRVGYLSLEEMLRPLGGPGGYCTSCWTGDYSPFSVPSYLQDNLKID